MGACTPERRRGPYVWDAQSRLGVPTARDPSFVDGPHLQLDGGERGALNRDTGQATNSRHTSWAGWRGAVGRRPPGGEGGRGLALENLGTDRQRTACPRRDSEGARAIWVGDEQFGHGPLCDSPTGLSKLVEVSPRAGGPGLDLQRAVAGRGCRGTKPTWVVLRKVSDYRQAVGGRRRRPGRGEHRLNRTGRSDGRGLTRRR